MLLFIVFIYNNNNNNNNNNKSIQVIYMSNFSISFIVKICSVKTLIKPVLLELVF